MEHDSEFRVGTEQERRRGVQHGGGLQASDVGQVTRADIGGVSRDIKSTATCRGEREYRQTRWGVVDKINWDAWLTAYVVLFYKCK